MTELEALALLKQIGNIEKGKSKNMHIKFDDLIICLVIVVILMMVFWR